MNNLGTVDLLFMFKDTDSSESGKIQVISLLIVLVLKVELLFLNLFTAGTDRPGVHEICCCLLLLIQ